MAIPAVPDAQWLWANEPCRAACPVHTDAGAYVTAIAEGRFEDAYLVARGSESVPVGLRTRVRRAVRACVSTGLGRRTGVDPGAQTLRHRTLRRRELRREHLLARGARRRATREPVRRSA